METLPKTFEEYLDQISQTRIELSDAKKLRNRTILSFTVFTLSLIILFIFSHGVLSMNTFFKRVMFTLSICGLVYVAHLFVNKLFPIAMSFLSQNGCMIGCLGFVLYLLKKGFVYALLAALVYWLLMLFLDELFGIYYLFDNSFAAANIGIVICAIIALVAYLSVIYRLMISIAHCKILKEHERLLEEYYKKNSLDLIGASQLNN